MTKLLHLLLATLLAFSLFGCSKGNPPETVPPETTAPVVTTEAATTEATTQPTETTVPVETTVATEPVETTVPTEEPTEPQGIPGTVTARSLNVRSAPGVGSPLVTTLPYGTSVTVYEKAWKDDMDWGRIDQGWVSLKYVKLESGSASVPTVTNKPTVKPSTPTQPTKPTTPEHKHAYSESVTKPTCTAQGYTTYKCSCGASYTGNQKAALGHSWSAWKTVTQPTQTAYGKAERKCTQCGITESKTLDKLAQTSHDHKYTETVTTAPSCETSGVKTFSCSCGASYTETIPAKGHSYTAQTVPASCSADGYTKHTCKSCGNSYTDAPVAATGHKYNSGTVTTKSRCEAPGVKTFSCKSCGASYTDTIPATGHAYTSQIVPASCGVSGYTKHTCSNCGKTYNDNQTAALDHSYSAWTTTTPPTETSTGTSSRTCTHCGRTETKTIPKLEPKPTEPKPTEPAPTEPKPTEPPVTEPPVTEHVHEWVHHHQDEVGHEVVYCTCHCGWTYPVSGDYISAHIEHSYAFIDNPEEFNKHSYYTTSKWVVDQPAKDWYECACGDTKPA